MSTTRGEHSNCLTELAVSFNAIERMIGADEPVKESDNNDDFDIAAAEVHEDDPKKTVVKSLGPPKKTLKGAWMKFAMEHHSFSNITMSKKDLANLSGGFHENLQPDEAGNQNLLLSLKYSFPAIPKPGQQPKPLTPDQKYQNMIFHRELKKLWELARERLKTRISSFIDGREVIGEEEDKTGGGNEEKKDDDDEATGESKRKMSAAGEGAKPKLKGDALTREMELQIKYPKIGEPLKGKRASLPESATPARMEQAVLNELGIKWLYTWVEYDEDVTDYVQNTKKQEKSTEARKAHLDFVKKKDSLRIRLPDNMQMAAAPSLSYGKQHSAVRATNIKAPQNTVEIMAGCGLKYVHATSKGRQGQEGDLERSRRQLLSMGHVLKENFLTEKTDNVNRVIGYDVDKSAYLEQRNGNEVLLEKTEHEKKLKEESARAFDNWVILKDMREQATKYLSFCATPTLEQKSLNSSSLSLSASMSKQQLNKSASVILSRSNSTGVITKTHLDVIEIGKALKKVDRTLFQDWAKWCEAVFTFNNANVLWDSFEPKSCDIHSPTSSQIRDAFMKIIKPGFDLKGCFTEFAEKQLKKNKERGRESRAESKDEKMKELFLSKNDMAKLLREIGILMKPTELRILIDSFDSNNDGKITLKEFIDFVGPKRERHGGSSVLLSKKCCWDTTCKVTGMAGAFSISNPSKRALRLYDAAADSKANDENIRRSLEMKEVDDYDDEDFDNGGAAEKASSKPVVFVRNGEKRMKTELEDRRRREKLLRRYDIVTDDDIERAAAERQAAEEKHSKSKVDARASQEYEDDAEFGETGKDSSLRCSFIKITNAVREEGLQFLFSVTKEARQEERLRVMLTNGKPPQPPKLWSPKISPDDEEGKVGDYDDGEITLPLSWAPLKDDLVSFFSVECCGPSGSAKSDRFVEICRDPKDASPDSKLSFQHILRRWNNAPLTAGATYSFRVRGFNGFGPGEYTYASFTTVPSALPAPKIVKLSSDSVTFRWKFTDSFLKRIEELKKMFSLADSDRSGFVDREELLLVLDEKASGNADLRDFLKKVALSIGVSIAGGYGAIFDMIENNDDNRISWDEFQNFFMGAGWAQSGPVDINASFAGSVKGSVAGSSAPAGAGSSGSITYVVEQCENEFNNVYKEIVKTSAGHATISRLLPGKSYRFRVFARNADGTAGPKSPTLVVHMMLETPAAPTLANKTVSARKVVLGWKGRSSSASTRDPQVIKKMLGDWAGSHGEDDGGVSIEQAFAKYDANRNGSIDASELALVLTDLGVDVTEEALREAYSILDKNGDGVISFEEFGVWWRRDDVSYTVKRSNAILPPSTPATAAEVQPDVPAASVSTSKKGGLGSIPEDKSVTVQSRAGGSKSAPVFAKAAASSNAVPMPVICHRGSNTKVEVAGLEPNRLYHFKLRYSGSKSNSQLSPPLVLMTAPLAPSAPLIVCLSSTVLRLKWYPPMFGAFKFTVQIRSLAMKGANKTAAASDDGWISVYNGPENYFTCTTMVPDSDYDIRVLSMNYQAALSEPSPVLSLTTLQRGDTSTQMTSKNANDYFTIDCTGDICVGDTVLFSERMYARPKAGSSAGAAALNKSTASVASLLQGYAPEGVFIGERTIAAHVVKDNYRTSRDYLHSSGITVKDGKKFSKHRNLWLEVVWQRSTTDACKPHDLMIGDVIERNQGVLEMFEVCRAPWKDEADRKELAGEWDALIDCYRSVE